MSLEFFAELFNSDQLLPLTIFLTDGRSISLNNFELMMIGSDSRSLSIFDPSTSSTEIIDLAQIVSARFSESKP